MLVLWKVRNWRVILLRRLIIWISYIQTIRNYQLNFWFHACFAIVKLMHWQTVESYFCIMNELATDGGGGGDRLNKLIMKGWCPQFTCGFHLRICQRILNKLCVWGTTLKDMGVAWFQLLAWFGTFGLNTGTGSDWEFWDRRSLLKH